MGSWPPVTHGVQASSKQYRVHLMTRTDQIVLAKVAPNGWVCMLNDKEIVRKASGGINDPYPFALSLTAWYDRTWYIRCLVLNTGGKTSVYPIHFVAIGVRIQLLLSIEEYN